MSMRYLGGFISASYNPLKVPNAPTIGTVTAGNAQVSVAFTAPSNVGGSAITSYTVIVTDSSSGAQFSNTGSASPIVVTGLTNGNTYTARVFAVNSYGPSAFSAPSGSFSYAPALYSWGINSGGQLGQNNTIPRSSPTQIGLLTNWGTIAQSNPYSGFVVMIKTDGTLWSWGTNTYGQLGQNNASYKSSPIQVGALTNWASAACGAAHTLAVKTDGTLWSWGRNDRGQLGQNIAYGNNKSSPVQIGVNTGWSRVACGEVTSYSIKTDGTFWSWGWNVYGQLGQTNLSDKSSPVQVGALTNWANSSAGKNQAVAVKTDGTMWSWGSDNDGALGLDTRGVYRSSPTQIGALTNWSKTSSGQFQSLAVKTNGTLWSWGNNVYGALGQNDRVARSSPTQVGALTTWMNTSSGDYYSLAVKTDGTLWSFGVNDIGQLGQNDKIYRSSPTQVGASTGWVSVYASSSISIANKV